MGAIPLVLRLTTGFAHWDQCWPGLISGARLGACKPTPCLIYSLWPHSRAFFSFDDRRMAFTLEGTVRRGDPSSVFKHYSEQIFTNVMFSHFTPIDIRFIANRRGHEAQSWEDACF